MFHILEAFLQTKPFVSESAESVRMAGTAGGEWKIFKLEAEEELRVEVNFDQPFFVSKKHNMTLINNVVMPSYREILNQIELRWTVERLTE